MPSSLLLFICTSCHLNPRAHPEIWTRLVRGRDQASEFSCKLQTCNWRRALQPALGRQEGLRVSFSLSPHAQCRRARGPCSLPSPGDPGARLRDRCHSTLIYRALSTKFHTSRRHILCCPERATRLSPTSFAGAGGAMLLPANLRRALTTCRGRRSAVRTCPHLICPPRRPVRRSAWTAPLHKRGPQGTDSLICQCHRGGWR